MSIPGLSAAVLGGSLKYSLALLVAIGLKGFYRSTDAESLGWILVPTCWIASTLAGLDFTPVAGVGLVSHDERLVVGPACAGVNFLVICLLTLHFGFVSRFETPRQRALWLLGSIGVAYVATLGTNALRIALAGPVYALDLRDHGFPPERLHHLLGTVVYCTSLMALYLCTERALPARSSAASVALASRLTRRLAPCAWYVGVCVVLPLLARTASPDARLAEHAALVIGVALCVAALASLPALLHDRVYSPRVEP